MYRARDTKLKREGAVARSLQHLLRAKPTAVLIASTTAPARPDDVIGCAMIRALGLGGRMPWDGGLLV